MSGRRLSLAVVVAAVAAPLPLAAQDVTATLARDTANVGDVVPVVVSVPVAAGERVAWPDTLPVGRGALENASRVRERLDTLAGGALARTGVYAVTPWRTGELELPELAVEVIGGRESPRRARVALPSLTVVTVLPPDTAGLEPRPARGVIGPSWAWGRIIALLALLAALLVGLIWWWRAKRRGEPEARAIAPLVPPRERALAALHEARDAGLLEAGEVKEFYVRWSVAVRDYAAALNGAWGEDLTTTELLARFRSHVGIHEAGALRDVLAPADQVKFARRVPDAETALAEWAAARAWVAAFDWPPRPVAPAEEAA